MDFIWCRINLSLLTSVFYCYTCTQNQHSISIAWIWQVKKAVCVITFETEVPRGKPIAVSWSDCSWKWILWILYLPSDCRVALTANVSEHFISTMGKDQSTTPGTSCPTLYDECLGSLTSPADHNSEDAGDGTYGLSSLSEKTRISNHMQMPLQRQHILLSYFKTLSVGPVWGSNPRPPAR